MPKCAFRHCRNFTSKAIKKDAVSYFRFPDDPFRCAEWISVVAQQRRQEFYTPSINSIVCSEHFDESDMYDTDDGVKLNDTAVPYVDLPDDITIVEISSTSSSKVSKNGPVNSSTMDSSSVTENKELMNTKKVANTSVVDSMDVVITSVGVNTTDLVNINMTVNEKKTINETVNTMEVVDGTLNTGDVVKTNDVNTKVVDSIESVFNMEVVNTPAEVYTSNLYSTSSDPTNTNEVDNMMEVIKTDNTVSDIIGPVTNAVNVMDLGNIEQVKDQLVDTVKGPTVDANTINSEDLQAQLIVYRKMLKEKNEIINMLYKKNDRLTKRLETLRKELRIVYKRIDRNTGIGQNLYKTLFLRYIRNYDHLYRTQPEDQNDEDEETDL